MRKREPPPRSLVAIGGSGRRPQGWAGVRGSGGSSPRGSNADARLGRRTLRCRGTCPRNGNRDRPRPRDRSVRRPEKEPRRGTHRQASIVTALTRNFRDGVLLARHSRSSHTVCRIAGTRVRICLTRLDCCSDQPLFLRGGRLSTRFAMHGPGPGSDRPRDDWTISCAAAFLQESR